MSIPRHGKGRQQEYDRAPKRGGIVASRVRQRVLHDVMRRGIETAIYEKDRKLSNALRRSRDLLIEELGDAAEPTALALIDALTRTKMLLDVVDAVLIEIGPGLVSKKRKVAAPILKQRSELAESLTSQLRALREFKSSTDIERRLEALEDRERDDEGHTYDATPTP